MKKFLLLIAMVILMCDAALAQRFTDNLGRGLVAVPTGSTDGSTTNFVSWRRLADEYDGVTYNLYKNGSLLASGLTTTSYDDNISAPPSTSYKVSAVVNGVEQTACDPVEPWAQYVYNYNIQCATGYLDIPLAKVYDRNGNDVTAHYEPNDAEMADLDGDGNLEIIIKRLNTADATGVNTGEMDAKGNEIYIIYPQNSQEFVVLDAYDVDWQTGDASLMWRIDCGPNMVSSNSTEINIIAYDWDEDGKAEVVLRGADNMIVYGSDGKKKLYTIGDMNVNTRAVWYSTRKSDGAAIGSMAYTSTGAEYLLYLNGETGTLYQMTDYPLKRLESNETDLNAAWGDGYGHRSSKYFFGAPFLDGRKASLFLARGIYTRHKMMAMNLDREHHKWSSLWTWNCNDKNSPWYGNGYHNFIIADVDEDGRDEIVYGSMVIDDNGKGLSTTGLGHGDAQHVSDFDPYRPGLEFFGCNEDKPGMNYRNATTSQLYVRCTAEKDDGRALMANFSNDYPGSLGRSVSSAVYSSVSDKAVEALNNDYIAWGDLNFRIYFDGDLCSEILNSPGTAKEAKIEKPGIGRLFTSSDCNMNNDSKNNPCFQGDIIGDWREEIMVRHYDKDQKKSFLRVYTTGMSTAYSLPCLWYDHQYRQAMVWQMMAYNQPPHLSYFLGEMEGITVAPPPLTNRGRTEIAKDGTIGTSLNGKHVLICDNVHTASSFTIAEGAQPTVLTVNTPKWVQGNNDNNSITTKNDYVHTLKGAALTGTTRLTKQGGGTLRLNNAVHTYTGKTDVWGGTLEFHGTLQNSALWLNRFTTLRSSGGTFNGGITADYGSTIIPGGEQSQGSITTTTLTLNHGARLLMDVYPDLTADKVNATKLVINTKTGDNWVNYGPQYLKPVVQIAAGGTLSNGTYDLGTVGQLTGNISDIVLEGVSNAMLDYADGHLLLVVGSGEPVFCTEPTIAEKTLQTTAEGILLPVVDITPTAFAYHDKTVIPTTTAVFTDLAGHQAVVDIIKTLYQQDFEASTNVADYWKNHNEGSSIFQPTYEGSTGQCIGIMSNNDRGDYTPITADYTGVTAYNIEFDAYFNNASKTTDFAVMSKSHFNSWIFNYGYHWKTSTSTEHNPFLLYLQRGESSTTFTVNETQNTISLSNSTWYHFVLQVDVVKGIVKYSIAKKTDGTVASSGAYALPAGESAECDGIYIRNGRYMYEPGGAGIDNIHVYATDLYEYAFTEPGTLTVTSTYEGCVPASTDCEAQFVGVRIGALGYTTLGCNYPLVVSSDELAAAGMEAAYVVANQKVNSVTLSEVQRVPAATGLLLKGAEGTYRLPIAAATDAVASNLLHAVTSVQGYAVVTDNVYALANKADGVGFYLCAQNIVVPAGKAYMQLAGANTRSYFTFDGTMTDGISTASTDSPSAEPYYYTPAGVRVANPRKGLYISRNRKVVISR